MFSKIIKNIAIFTSGKLVHNAMANNLKIQNVSNNIKRNFDKNKEYLLYIHVPFCHTFCSFCSFHKFGYDETLAKNYFKSLRLELQKAHDEGFQFNALYVGGGTTLINEKELIETLELAKKLFNIQSVSCESDPNHLDPDSIKRFSGLIDRLSIGIQSFDDGILKKSKRYEKFGGGEEIARKVHAMAQYVPHTSIDLIFNFPDQTKEMLLRDLDIAKNLGVSQITTYPLMHSDLNAKTIRNAFGSNENNKEYEFYQCITEELKDFKKNNAWSFSKEATQLNDEYVGAHNEYIGLGSGAFSFLDGDLLVNAFDLDQYAKLISQNSHAIIAQSTFSQKEQLKYHFLTQFFTGKIDIGNFNTNFGCELQKDLSLELSLLKFTGAINIQNNTIINTDFGDYLALCFMKEFYSGMDMIRAMFRNKYLSDDKSACLLSPSSEKITSN